VLVEPGATLTGAGVGIRLFPHDNREGASQPI
jgi:hypothetical protein